MELCLNSNRVPYIPFRISTLGKSSVSISSVSSYELTSRMPLGSLTIIKNQARRNLSIQICGLDEENTMQSTKGSWSSN